MGKNAKTNDPEQDVQDTEEKRRPIARIAARRAGFRRAGIAHSTEAIVYYEGDLTPAQLKQLLAEPLLVVDVDPAVLEEMPEG